jgi:hypothetical protein
MPDRFDNRNYTPSDEAGDLLRNIKQNSKERWKALPSLDMSRSEVAHIFVLAVVILLGIATYYVFRAG